MSQTGCFASEGSLELRATLDGVPLAQLEITALPYDAERVLDSLERESPVPRPEFPDLEVELLAFQRRDPDSLARFHSGWVEAREGVARLADSLNTIDRQATGYAGAYARFRTAYRSLAGLEAGLERRMRAELGEDRDLARRAAAAADSLRAWERDTYRAMDSLTAGLDEVRVVSDDEGRARLDLAPGRWWLVARVPDAENPFVEHSWQVPVVVSALVPVVVPISSRNVTLRWRR